METLKHIDNKPVLWYNKEKQERDFAMKNEETKKDLKKNPPKDRSALTLTNMLDYVEAYHNEKLHDFAEIILSNKTNGKTKFKLKEIREQFLKLFGENEEFAGLKEKGKKKETKAGIVEDRIKTILNL